MGQDATRPAVAPSPYRDVREKDKEEEEALRQEQNKRFIARGKWADQGGPNN